ncbi:MAG: thiamine phosphate synthase [Kineosporiaceae bacterium]
MPGALVVLTDRVACSGAGHDLVAVCVAAVSAGADAVLVREKDLPLAERVALVTRVAQAVGSERVLVAETRAPDPRRVARWARLEVAGLHLAGGVTAGVGADDPVTPDPLVTALPWGRSCHTVAEVCGAVRQGGSWATVSPVAASPSKPGYGPALGVDGVRALAAAASVGAAGSVGSGRSLARAGSAGGDALARGPLPLLALGGVDASTVATWLAAGAAGVAVMGAVMAAADPGAVVSALVQALAEAAPAAVG